MRLAAVFLVLLVAAAPALTDDTKPKPDAKPDADTAEFLKPDNWEGLKEYWTATGTSVTGSAKVDPKFNTFFCSKKKYGDFELQFKVKLVGGKGNSGIQVRSVVTDKKKFVVHGPQCDMGQQYWGSLYGEGVGGMMLACPGDFVKKHVKPDAVNDYQIKVEKNHFTIKVNGETSVDKDFPATPDKKPTAAEGTIAFQLHAGGPMTVEFTDIKFKDLAKK